MKWGRKAVKGAICSSASCVGRENRTSVPCKIPGGASSRAKLISGSMLRHHPPGSRAEGLGKRQEGFMRAIVRECIIPVCSYLGLHAFAPGACVPRCGGHVGPRASQRSLAPGATSPGPPELVLTPAQLLTGHLLKTLRSQPAPV